MRDPPEVCATSTHPDDNGMGGGGYTDPTNYLTPVGAFSSSPGAYGTFDQGGEVWQWNERPVTGSSRGLRGGSWYYYSSDMASSDRDYYFPPTYENSSVGLRV
ncbi:MAG: hypothetical protein ABSG68_19615, partial [Thermoguttaceae bacterium]